MRCVLGTSSHYVWAVCVIVGHCQPNIYNKLAKRSGVWNQTHRPHENINSAAGNWEKEIKKTISLDELHKSWNSSDFRRQPIDSLAPYRNPEGYARHSKIVGGLGDREQWDYRAKTTAIKCNLEKATLLLLHYSTQYKSSRCIPWATFYSRSIDAHKKISREGIS